MYKHNLTPVLNKQRPDKDGNYPLRIRSIIKRKITYYPTGIMIKQSEWDKVNKKVILHKSKTHYNAVISNKIAELERTLIEQSLSGNQALKVLPPKLVSFKGYAEAKIKAWAGRDSKITTRNKTSYLSKFNEFKPGAKLTDITPSLLQDYEKHCRDSGNQGNTIWGAIKFVRTIINAALTDEVLTRNPMKGYKIPAYKNPARNFLTKDELDRIEDIAINCPNLAFKNTANWFLFSAYSGLRYSDIKTFSKEKIINGRIILRTEKTGSDVSIKVHPPLHRAINRLSTNITTNQDYNRSLKAVAVIAKIDKPLTSHLGRHSFGIMFLRQGGSIETLSKILGHSSIRTTQIYARVINLKIDKEVDDAFKEL